MTKTSAPPGNPVADGFELMKKMWGLSGLPGLPSAGSVATMAARIPQLPSMMAPTFDVDELDKRITDLRTVEHWLELNSSILRTTIQSLEVQRATIATLKGFGGAMLAPMKKSAPPPEVELGLAAMQTEEAGAAAAVGRQSGMTDQSGKALDPASAAIAATPFNPAAWWSTLQEQFARIAASAGEQPAPARPRARKGAKRARKAKRG